MICNSQLRQRKQISSKLLELTCKSDRILCQTVVRQCIRPDWMDLDSSLTVDETLEEERKGNQKRIF